MKCRRVQYSSVLTWNVYIQGAQPYFVLGWSVTPEIMINMKDQTDRWVG